MAKKSTALDQQKGFFQDIILQGKLILRLMSDKEVNFLLKLLPIAALVYVVSPVDLLPGLMLPVIGALDDAAVLWLGMTLFMTLCPDEVVQKHRDALEKVVHGTWRDAPEETSTAIVEAQPQEAAEDDQTGDSA
jgi:uncharacterized membrane protein YkvA (DUF1232 family)